MEADKLKNENNVHTLLCTDFERWLRENKINSEYRCDGCGYSQGHQIIWCPKCGNKVIQRKNVSYWDCVKYGDLRNSLYFKMQAEVLSGNTFLQWEIYNKVCDELEKICI